MYRVIMTSIVALVLSVATAQAHNHHPVPVPTHHHSYHPHRYHHHHHHTVSYGGGYADGRPAAWCGWEMRRLVGADPGPAYNLARNWAHWGSNAGGPGIGVIVVWPHHVGKITGQQNGEWVVLSGNDGHAVRERPRKLGGAIAFRHDGTVYTASVYGGGGSYASAAPVRRAHPIARRETYTRYAQAYAPPIENNWQAAYRDPNVH